MLISKTALFIFLLSIPFVAESQQAITIIGRWQTSEKAIDNLTVMFCDDAITQSQSRFKLDVDSIGNFRGMIPTNKPLLLGILYDEVLTYPGDTVFFDVTGEPRSYNLSFKGRDAASHGFFMNLKMAHGRFEFDKHKLDNQDDLMHFKSDAKAYYVTALDYLDSVSSNRKINTERTSVLKQLVTIDYYRNLLYGLRGLSNIPQGYLLDIDGPVFKDTRMLDFLPFEILLAYYNESVLTTWVAKEHRYDVDVTEKRIASADKCFSEPMANAIQFRMLFSLADHGTKENAPQVEYLYRKLSDAYKGQSTRIKKIREMKTAFEQRGKPLSEDLLKTKLFDLEESTTTLGKVLSQGQTVYMDLWASWCGPCVAEMPLEKELINKLGTDHVKFLLVSIDKNDENWKRGVKKIGVPGEHFRIDGEFNSALLKDLFIKSIPRYLILDKDGTVISNNAPRPGILLKNSGPLTAK